MKSAVAVVLGLMLVVPVMAREDLVFADFDSVEAWPGFELSREQAHSGKTSALWRDMPATPRVTSKDIPHDWSAYSAFTFWVYNEKKLPTAFMVIISSENPKTEGPDYWSVKVKLDFTGWKMFGLLIRPGGGARSPRGWDQIDSITFTASGWNNTPHPEAVVHVDELRLTDSIGGTGPAISDREFYGLLREDIAALAPVREAAAAEDWPLAEERLLQYMRERTTPVHRFDWRDWDKKRDPKFNTSRADRAMQHIFKWQGREGRIPGDIDWTYTPFDRNEPAYTPEWTYDLNRFGFWRDLGRAYWATGDEKYAQEFVTQMMDWIHDQPPPVLGSPNTAPCWRTIEQGIRTAGSWMDAYYYFLGSPSMTPHAHATFLKSFVDHARTLTRMTVEHPEHGGNWVTMECNGLAHIGVMFPEFTEAERWRQVAYDRLLQELDRQVYPDGAQMELSTGYHQVARGNFMRALEPAQRNNVEVPAEYLDKLKRMYWYNLYAMRPDLRLPPLNDAGDTAVQGTLQEAYDTWGDEQFLWGATGGTQGEPLDFTSYFFPWAGQAIMRSGWRHDDRYLMFEIGPFGTGHQHEDKLGIYLFAYGRPLLTEAGTYSYDHSKWRRYALATASHNTIMVDGLGQHRRGLRETYQNTEPMTGCWETNEVFDWARGVYDNGYGPRIGDDGKALGRDEDITDVRHERTVIFVRPDYYLVIDRLLGNGGEAHTYSNLFHFDAEEASADEETLVVSSTDAGKANLTLVPLATDGLSLRMVKGQEDPVQGWIPREHHRAIPTAIYEKTGPAPELFVTLLVPHPTPDAPEMQAELVADDSAMIGVRVTSDAGEDVILYAFDGPADLQAAGVSAHAQLAVVRRPEGGQVSAGLMGGVEVRVDGDLIAPAP
ncbi:MAG: heparinase II/III family protein [Armatimonadetes bacterium]|nr:heparinase II/III family protein [Armatimonadota bacterium]